MSYILGVSEIEYYLQQQISYTGAKNEQLSYFEILTNSYLLVSTQNGVNLFNANNINYSQIGSLLTTLGGRGCAWLGIDDFFCTSYLFNSIDIRKITDFTNFSTALPSGINSIPVGSNGLVFHPPTNKLFVALTGNNNLQKVVIDSTGFTSSSLTSLSNSPTYNNYYNGCWNKNNDLVYFAVTNGHIVVIDPYTELLVYDIDLSSLFTGGNVNGIFSNVGVDYINNNLFVTTFTDELGILDSFFNKLIKKSILPFSDLKGFIFNDKLNHIVSTTFNGGDFNIFNFSVI
jgi:hypothetical protein